MPDIIGVQPAVSTKPTSVSPGQLRNDLNGRNETSQPIADPGRVVRTGDQNVNTSTEAFRFSRDSNFDSFIRALRQVPELLDVYNDVFMTKLTNTVGLATYGAVFADNVNEFMLQIDMTPDQLTNLMKEQNMLTNKFTGPFFDIVRNMISNGSSRELTVAVLEFLKRYDAVTSDPHTEEVLISNINGVISNIPKSRATQLAGIMQNYPENATHTEKLAFFKNQVMPFLTKYVSQTHDYGVARDLTAMFAVNLGKYETGSTESFAESFRNLAGYMQLAGMLEGVDIPALQEKLMAGFDQDGDSRGTRILDAFVSILSEGLGGSAGVSNKAAMGDMISSLLVNESVYMPLTHMVIPANIEGRMMFSEMWVDPDAEGSGSSTDARTSRIFVKFMIKELGSFDLLINEKDGRTSVELHYPEILAEKSQDIRHDIPEIIRNNNLKIESFSAGRGKTEKSLIEIFPKIFTQKTSVDVSI